MVSHCISQGQRAQGFYWLALPAPLRLLPPKDKADVFLGSAWILLRSCQCDHIQIWKSIKREKLLTQPRLCVFLESSRMVQNEMQLQPKYYLLVGGVSRGHCLTPRMEVIGGILRDDRERDWGGISCSPAYHEPAGALGMNRWLQAGMLPVPGGLHPPSSPVGPLLIPRPFYCSPPVPLISSPTLTFWKAPAFLYIINHGGLNAITKYKNLLLYYY